MKKQPSKPATTRCAIYTRKSTTMGLDQEFNSLDAQRDACLAYIERQPGWTLVETRYDDGGFTGANIERPAFQRLLSDIEAGKIDVVVVYKVDRLSRSLLDFAKVMERLSGAGASFVSVTQNFSTADAMGRLTLNMLMSFAEFEREMIAERTRDKVAAARRKGKWTGGPVPFGYDVVDKHLVINELEAVIVREAFELLLQHRRPSHVAQELNERGHFPRGTRLPQGKPPRWTKDSIARILRSPIYAGQMMYGEERHAGEHSGLVDVAVYDRAQLILGGAEREHTFHGTNPAYLLRGLLHCGLCNAAMTPGSTRKAGKEYRYYRCSTRGKQGTEACTAAPLPAPAIEGYVVERIVEAAVHKGLAHEVDAALALKLKKKKQGLATRKARLPSQLAVTSANASRLADDLTRLDGRARQVVETRLRVEAEKLAQLESQLAQVEQEAGALEHVEADAAWVVNALDDFAKVWDVLSLANRGRLLRALVDRVHVDEPSGRVEVHLANISPDAVLHEPEEVAA